MTDETRTDEPGGATGTAVAEPRPGAPEKLTQDVQVRDIGPCKKHIRVAIDRNLIDKRLNDQFTQMVRGKDTEGPIALPGFRPGKAPRALIERKFAKEVKDQIKGEILLQSLEQLADEHDIAPLSPPNLDPFAVELPKEGPLVYEFEVEVRPEFDLPNYRGLKLLRPVKEFSDADVEAEVRRFLAPYGTVVPKDGPAEIGDILIADMVSKAGARVLNNLKEVTLRVDARLAFKDGVAEKFGEQVKGAKAGDVRTVDVDLSMNAAEPALHGKRVQSILTIKDVKTVRMPTLTHEFLHQLGVHTEEQFHELVRVLLNRRLEYQQRQAARKQVMDLLANQPNLELPRDLLIRQARSAMQRRAMEMRSEGIPEPEINTRLRLLEQDILESTKQSLKEHFVLQKIAEIEKLDVDDDDLENEIDRIAAQNNESPRRLRARLEKDDLLDTLATELIERKALDLILDAAEYEDIPMDAEEGAVESVEQQAVPGEMQDVTAEQAQPETPPPG